MVVDRGTRFGNTSYNAFSSSKATSRSVWLAVVKGSDASFIVLMARIGSSGE